MTLRVGLIGARRVRQGLGPFIARDLVRAGAEVAAVLGRTKASAEEAARDAERWAGLEEGSVRPTSTDEAFFGSNLDAVCVLTPAGTHGAYVAQALEAGCHVLAEKPFLWAPETDWAERAFDLETRFAEAGLVLAVNAQWPCTIPALAEALGTDVEALRQDGTPAAVGSLIMELEPASTGLQMIGDSVPHPLSLAQALRPSLTDIESIRVVDRGGPNRLSVVAKLVGSGSPLHLVVNLGGSTDSDGGPKVAEICIDGVRVRRCIRRRDYAMFFSRGADLVDLPDPLTLRIQDFVRETEQTRGPREPGREISTRARMLKSIVDAFGAST